MFKEIHEAYKTLTDEGRRRQYDEENGKFPKIIYHFFYIIQNHSEINLKKYIYKELFLKRYQKCLCLAKNENGIRKCSITLRKIWESGL